MKNSLGRPLDRVEGKLKVTGGARYTGDIMLPRMTYAVLIESSVASGTIQSMDTRAAMRSPGVVTIITSTNAPKLKAPEKEPSGITSEGHLALQSNKIHYNGEPIGLVVAESLEEARAALALIKVSYGKAAAFLNLEDKDAPSIMPKDRFGKPLQGKRGEPDAAFSEASVTVEARYETPLEHHHPMEPHATVAAWSDGALTVYETTQYVNGTQNGLAQCFSLKPERVKVISNFVGGGFGSKGSTWQPTVMAAMAARVVQRPVKLVLSRQNMCNCVGHRSRTIQDVALAADKSGKISAIRHAVQSHTSLLQDFIEPSSLLTRMLYANPGLELSHRLARLNLPTSTFMRAPGEASGSFALECALDELALKLEMDPLALRVINHADKDMDSGKVFSAKQLKECYEKGAELFGWSQRKAAPKSMQRNGRLVGWGVATATYPANKQPASARMRIHRDASIVAASATHEIGQGTYTIMTQIAAEAMGVDPGRVRFELGSSLFPKAPVTGGSMTAASVGPAVVMAANALKMKLLGLAAKDAASPLYQLTFDQIQAVDGHLVSVKNAGAKQSYQDILRAANLESLEAEGSTQAMVMGDAKEHCRPDQSQDPSCYSYHSFGAQFAEVEVDPLSMQVRVTRFVGAYDVGRVLNEKTARSQGLGGIVMGIGMALMEETAVDPRNGRMITRNLADYHVPVNADIQNIEVIFTNVPDKNFNELGSRGLGEIPIVGAAAAVANAVYHATGKRIRQLPITPDKLLV
ncbi:MAG TPA: xanthine dehydrogenase family protein molybdopterin-binding subunit [Oligoflexus sp.]|uniref:xanthine dehydrogenase family protein molybdopterin-binding subunit n=1 Tax=Oligoflexus sp. TaxID=1971216 RepID=UPI002D7E25D5|nr:xanthine dehydrogenase family protein molybdopterin-binding subunit [Oligoflexus sp.]HET9241387.1 xanthine dehydrogenase family protein molybdopterin-binding subunit [Oligoflexus sp.]